MWDSDSPSELKWYYRNVHIATAKYPAGMGMALMYGVNSKLMKGDFEHFTHQSVVLPATNETGKRTAIVCETRPYLAGEQGMAFDDASVGNFFKQFKNVCNKEMHRLAELDVD